MGFFVYIIFDIIILMKTPEIPFNKDLVKSIVNKKIPSLEEKEFFDSLGFQEFINELKK